MAWVSSDGNSGFYRDFSVTGAQQFPRTRPPFACMVDICFDHDRPGTGHNEWKFPVAFNNQSGTRGQGFGPMHQDTLTWESFAFGDAALDFGYGEPRGGLANKYKVWSRSIASFPPNLGTSANNSSPGFINISVLGRAQIVFQGRNAVGTVPIGAMTNISVGYSRSNYIYANGDNSTPAGALTTMQPMLAKTAFCKATFWDIELPYQIANELSRGRHPLDLPRPFRPIEYYPMDNPAETNPRCLLTGNTLTAWGSGMQFVSQATITSNSIAMVNNDSSNYYIPNWQKNGYRQAVASLSPVPASAKARAIYELVGHQTNV